MGRAQDISAMLMEMSESYSPGGGTDLPVEKEALFLLLHHHFKFSKAASAAAVGVKARDAAAYLSYLHTRRPSRNRDRARDTAVFHILTEVERKTRYLHAALGYSNYVHMENSYRQFFPRGRAVTATAAAPTPLTGHERFLAAEPAGAEVQQQYYVGKPKVWMKWDMVRMVVLHKKYNFSFEELMPILERSELSICGKATSLLVRKIEPSTLAFCMSDEVQQLAHFLTTDELEIAAFALGYAFSDLIRFRDHGITAGRPRRQRPPSPSNKVVVVRRTHRPGATEAYDFFCENKDLLGQELFSKVIGAILDPVLIEEETELPLTNLTSIIGVVEVRRK